MFAAAPPGWRTNVTVLRGGGRNARGIPQPETRLSRQGVLVGWRSSSEPVDRSEVTSDLAVLYDADPAFTYQTGDRVVVPVAHNGPTGVWQIDGQPKKWPVGSEVPLRRAP